MGTFTISGYWVDDNSTFEDYIVVSGHDNLEDENDDNIFFYGLDKEAIENAIKTLQPINNEFVITSYKKE